MGIIVEPLTKDSSLPWISQALDYPSGAWVITGTGTNTTGAFGAPVSRLAPSRTDHAVDFALRNYEQLLRRLAD